jgi:hypothetical protein
MRINIARVRVFSKLTGCGIEGWYTIINRKAPPELLLLMKVYDGLEILEVK